MIDCPFFIERQKYNKMNYQLTGITKRSKFIYYHICYIYADGRTKYLEMRREVFRSIYNFKVDQNKRMLCATRKKKRNAKTIEKFNRIKEILSEFDTFTADEQITSLCATLERLGSL